jgi:hypothetical protein
MRDGSGGGGFGGGRVALGGGCGTLLIIILGLIFGFDPQQYLRQTQQPQQPPATQQSRTGGQTEDQAKQFVATVLADTEDYWNGVFQKNGRRYREPKLVLYSNRINTACGLGDQAAGPFYCPGDERVYLDLTFFREMKTRFQAPGDFAQAYVIAHEIGHHVQQLLGTSEQVERMQRRSSERQSNELSVRLELQADFYAGMWARYAMEKGYLERGDLEEALNAASAVGDDRLQSRSQGYVVPDSFTHGTSAQRARWFKKGLDTGDIRQGNTFNTRDL